MRLQKVKGSLGLKPLVSFQWTRNMFSNENYLAVKKLQGESVVVQDIENSFQTAYTKIWDTCNSKQMQWATSG